MKPTHRPPRMRHLLPLVAAICTWAAAAPAAEPAATPHPADPAAGVPPAGYRSAIPDSARGGLQSVDAPRREWPRLFEPDGRFASMPGGGTAPAAAHAGHAGHMMPGAAPAPAPAPAPGPGPGAAAGSDARGIVKAVDGAQGKLTLRHGPIARLEMPGMTMVFRVKDPALLDGLAPGDEVGFDVEVDGTTFYVTGIRK